MEAVVLSVSMQRDRKLQIKYEDSGKIVFPEVNIVQMTFQNRSQNECSCLSLFYISDQI